MPVPFKPGFLLAALFAGVLLLACSDDDTVEYPFERTVLDISANKRCADGTSTPGVRCYQIHWRHPIEREGLLQYHFWLDTLVVKPTDQVLPNGATASSIKAPYRGAQGDFDSLDVTSLLTQYDETRDSLAVAVWAEYNGGDQGAVQHLWLYFGDDVPPSVAQHTDSTDARNVWTTWTRPHDQVDFYFPSFLNGTIAGYTVIVRGYGQNLQGAGLTLTLAGKTLGEESYKRNHQWRVGNHAAEMVPIPQMSLKDSVLTLAVIDGHGFDTTSAEANQFRLRVGGLTPGRNYTISVQATDSAGNYSSPSENTLSTTDTVAPLIANRFWLAKDTADGLPRLDSNRLALFWPRSVDPLAPGSGIQIDSTLRIDTLNCKPGICYNEVKTYSLETWNATAKAWTLPERKASDTARYTHRFDLVDGQMQSASAGMFVTDTLRWVAPGDTLILRLRAQDASGHYSKAWVDTLVVSAGALGGVGCPEGYAPALRASGADTLSFCMEKTEHKSGATFARNLLARDAQAACQALSGTAGFEGWTVDLCAEEEWTAACRAGGAQYGVVEEQPFMPLEFLYQQCNVGTLDSLPAIDPAKTRPRCLNALGVRDLPGNLQEWVLGLDSAGTSPAPVLKGTSYLSFEGADRTELAGCGAVARPFRKRPAAITDTVWLYRNSSRIDTLLAKDTSRTLYYAMPPSEFTDTILIYKLSHPTSGDSLGTDYVNAAELRQRGKEWLEVMWRGLSAEQIAKRTVMFRDTAKVDASHVYLEPSVGFRCCAKK